MSKFIKYQENHILVGFRFFLNDVSRKYELNTIIDIDFRKVCFKKIVDIISPYVFSNKEDCIKIIKKLLEAIPGYSRGFKTRNDVLCNNLYFRAGVEYLEQNKFWRLSQNYISIWYDLTYKERLNYKQSQILLGCFWCHSYYNSFKKTEPAFLRIGEIKELTKFSEDTVKKYMVDLSKKGIIKILEPKGRRKEYFLKSLPKSILIFRYNKNPFVGDICLNIDFDDINLIRFIYSSDYNLRNPFLYIKPNGVIAVNRQILNMEYVIASILSEDELKKLLLISHTKRSIGYTLKSINKRLKEYVNIIKNTKPPIDLLPHFHQIYKILPLLDYIGRRYYEIDFDKLQHFLHYYKYRMKVAKKRFSMIYEVFIKTGAALFDWKYLFECLGKNNSEKEWQKKYKMEDIRLMPLNLGFPMEKIQVCREKIKFSNNKELLEQLKWYQVDEEFIRIDALTEDKFNGIRNTAWGGQELFDYYVANNALNNLLQIGKCIETSKTISVISAPSVLGNPTHRIYTCKISSQNISKKNRPIIRAKTGHQFFMIDVRQMELELIKWYVQKEYSNNEISDLTFESIATNSNVKRDTAKDLFYKWSYGASQQTILKETDATEEEYKRFREYIKKTSIYDFKKKIEEEIRRSYVTRETPLGFRVPIFSGAYKGLPYLIQAAGSELFIRWLQMIHEAGRSIFIVNVIHDEIIFEIPVNFNLYKFTKVIKECLNKASQELFGDLTFDTKQCAARYWDDTTGSVIDINSVRY